MNTQSQIDATLRLIGNAPPPSGLEHRVNARLEAPRHGFTAVHSISAVAIAASVAIAALALGPLAGDMALRHSPGVSGSGTAGSIVPRVSVPVKGAFGAASAVHVPSALLPVVAAAPVNHGRGHTRSGRATLPPGSRAPHAAGVAVPAEAVGRQVHRSGTFVLPSAGSATLASTAARQ